RVGADAVDTDHADKLREAMGSAGAGEIGNYEHCKYLVQIFRKETAGSQRHVSERISQRVMDGICQGDDANASIRRNKTKNCERSRGI
ncbi:MAG: hypothetical protein K0Q64_1679, partial [Nitrobacter vulgaris]|nr:hypothetical protein [Nitrobacter vulgaris]